MPSSSVLYKGPVMALLREAFSFVSSAQNPPIVAFLRYTQDMSPCPAPMMHEDQWVQPIPLPYVEHPPRASKWWIWGLLALAVWHQTLVYSLDISSQSPGFVASVLFSKYVLFATVGCLVVSYLFPTPTHTTPRYPRLKAVAMAPVYMGALFSTLVMSACIVDIHHAWMTQTADKSEQTALRIACPNKSSMASWASAWQPTRWCAITVQPEPALQTGGHWVTEWTPRLSLSLTARERNQMVVGRPFVLQAWSRPSWLFGPKSLWSNALVARESATDVLLPAPPLTSPDPDSQPYRNSDGTWNT